MLQNKNREKILFFRESTFRVAENIFNYPNKTFHIRMLEEKTGFSTTAVTNSAEELLKFKIIKIEETNLTKNIKADLESEAFRFYKLVFNLYRLKKYGLVDLIKDIFNNPKAIAVFGSFAKGEDIEESDIDILVLSSKKEKVDYRETIKEIEEALNRKINIHHLPSLEKSSKEFKNAVANGIVLHGYLKVI